MALSQRALALTRTCLLLDAGAAAAAAMGAVASFWLATRTFVIYGVMASCGACALGLGALLIARGLRDPGRIRSAAVEGLIAGAAGAAVVGLPAVRLSSEGVIAWIRDREMAFHGAVPKEAFWGAVVLSPIMLLAAANIAALIALRRARRGGV